MVTGQILFYAIHFPLHVYASYLSLLSFRGPSLELGFADTERVSLLMLASLIEDVW
jgi:hypothetical protein